MQLFEDIHHEYVGPRQPSEPSFEYLNRSARPRATRIREVLEGWTDRFPSDGKTDLVERFRSRDDAQHYGALLEMYCCELIRAHGLLVESHPTTETPKRTHPDFLVLKSGDPVCYVECTLAADPMVDPAEQARRNTVLEGLNKLDPGRFLVTVEFDAVGDASPSVAKLRREIQAWLGSLEEKALRDSEPRSGSPATRVWTIDGWTLTLHAHRSNRDGPGAGRRGIAGQMKGMRYVDSSGRLLRALSQKAKRYGRDLGLPYVVAVNSLDDILEDYDVMEALFGQMRYTVNIKTGRTREERVPNGLWTSTSGYQYRRVSGVLLIGNLTPWTLWTTAARLWHHPDPLYSLEPSTWRIPQMLADNSQGKIVARGGEPAASVLGLEQAGNCALPPPERSRLNAGMHVC